MIALAHFLHFLSFSLGLVSVYISIVLFKQTGYRTLRSYTLFLIGFNVIVFFHVLEAFLKTVLSDAFFDQYFRDLLLFLVIPLGALRLFMAWLFLFFCYQLVSRTLHQVFGIIAILIFLSFLTFALLTNFETNTGNLVEGIVINTIHFMLSAAMVYGSVLVLKQSGKAKQIRSRMIVPVFTFFLVFALVQFLNRQLINFPPGETKEDQQMLGLSVLALVFNLFNVILLNRTFTKPAQTPSSLNMRKLEEYGITKREQEIIKLICLGKTNKEIGEILYISPLTVRDHTSNIFRKTGVTSRTQLAGLFNSSSH
jgi:DNA-binding CsgD family transcriptional regulator